ncbi:MAG: hypothetical protein QG588_150 [Candidatus Poribacteria bacterium]|nr:hypothetical protein [Candidatus Poribacteria bacterium]
MLEYRVFDPSLQVDMIIGVDPHGGAVEESLASLEKDEPRFTLGVFYGAHAEISKKLENLYQVEPESTKGKRLLFVRSVNFISCDSDTINEINNSILLFSTIKNIFRSSQCYFLLALSEGGFVRLEDDMYFAHIKTSGDIKPNEFKRIVMSRLGQLLAKQNGTGLIAKKDGKYNAIQKTFNGIEYLEVDFNKEYAYRITENGVHFDIFCNFKKTADTLVVFGQSALMQDSVSLPVFRRWSWSREIEHSVIVLNDPTLYLSKELEAGWFIGTKEHDYTKTMAKIIKKLAFLSGIESSNIIFIGASAGGFTSMTMASHIKGSSCVVDVPQTNLLTYLHTKEIDKIARFSFGVEKAAEITDMDKRRLVVTNVFEDYGYIPNIYYLQNCNDVTAGHLQTQFSDFVSSLSSLMLKRSSLIGAKIHLEMYDRKHLIRGGHFPLPESITLSYLSKAIKEFKNTKRI